MNPLFQAFKTFQAVDDRFPVNAALSLLYIANHEPCFKQEMENALGFNSASGSRNTDYLCKINRLKKPGLGFIAKEEDFHDRRRSILTLTDKGRHFIESLDL